MYNMGAKNKNANINAKTYLIYKGNAAKAMISDM